MKHFYLSRNYLIFAIYNNQRSLKYWQFDFEAADLDTSNYTNKQRIRLQRPIYKREIPSHRVILTQTLATGAIERVFPVETGVSETIRLEIRFLKEQPQTGYSRNKKPNLKILSDAGWGVTSNRKTKQHSLSIFSVSFFILDNVL